MARCALNDDNSTLDDLPAAPHDDEDVMTLNIDDRAPVLFLQGGMTEKKQRDQPARHSKFHHLGWRWALDQGCDSPTPHGVATPSYAVIPTNF